MSFDSEVPSEFIPRSGEWVRELQRLLERAGYWSQERSEEYDDRVESAVKLFQGGYGLEVDGVPNSATWAALAQVSEAPETDARTVEIDWENDFPEIHRVATAENLGDYLRSLDIDPSVFDDEALIPK